MNDHKPRSKIVLNELKAGSTSKRSTRVVDDVIVQLTSNSQRLPSQITLPPKHNRRVVRQPDLYLGISEAQGVISDNNVDNPLSFKHAMEDSDKEEWLKARDRFHVSNSVWELVDLPDGIKLIGSKWIYKRKRGVDEKVETFK